MPDDFDEIERRLGAPAAPPVDDFDAIEARLGGAVATADAPSGLTLGPSRDFDIPLRPRTPGADATAPVGTVGPFPGEPSDKDIGTVAAVGAQKYVRNTADAIGRFGGGLVDLANEGVKQVFGAKFNTGEQSRTPVTDLAEDVRANLGMKGTIAGTENSMRAAGYGKVLDVAGHGGDITGEALPMIAGGGVVGKGLAKVGVHGPVNTVLSFGLANIPNDPKRPGAAFLNGTMAGVGSEFGRTLFKPAMAAILDRLGPRAAHVLDGLAQGVGMTAAPSVDENGQVRNMLAEGDFVGAATLVLTNMVPSAIASKGAIQAAADSIRADAEKVAADPVRDEPTHVTLWRGRMREAEAEGARLREQAKADAQAEAARDAAVAGEPTPGEPVEVTFARGKAREAEVAAPEAPAAPREEVIQPRGRVRSADALEREGSGKSLSQAVRAEGGLDLTGTNLTGEVNALRLKESGTTGLVAPKGGGRSKSVQRMMEAMKERGFDIEGWSETQFVERVLADVAGERTLNPAEVDTAKLGEAVERRRAEEAEARLAELPPAERAQVEAEMRRSLEESRVDAEEAAAMGAEGRGEIDADVDFDFGFNAPEAAKPKGKAFSDPGEPNAVGDVGNARLPLSMEPLPGMEGVKPTGPQEVIAALGDVVEAPIRVGRMAQGKSTRGVFKVHEEVVRVREANNIPTATHEVGHALSKMTDAKAGIESPAIKRELVRLGKDLYGNKKPEAGFTEEGFAELIRLHVTNPTELAKRAPKAAEWFDNTFLPAHPESQAALLKARAAASRYSDQGAAARAQAGMVLDRAGPGAIAKIKSFIGIRNQVEEFKPLADFARAVEAQTGQKLAPSDNPYEVASAARMSGPAVVRGWIDGQGTTDVAGNVTGGTLNTAIAPAAKVDPGLKSFRAYLWARQALDMHSNGMNPGMAKADAEFIASKGGPEFELAADNYYKWRARILDYAVDSGLYARADVDKMLAKWPHSTPLKRVFDEPASALGRFGSPGGKPIMRLKGSGRRIRDPLATTIEQAEAIQRASDRYRVLRAIDRHADVEGIGRIIENVPKDMVPHEFRLEDVKRQLIDAGVDLSVADMEAKLLHFSQASRPKGKDPIYQMPQPDGTTKWRQIPVDLFESLEGLDVYRLPKALDLTFGALARTFRMGTTGYNATFGTIRNPTKDLPTFLMQSQGNPLTAGASYARAMAEVMKQKSGAGQHPYADLMERLGVSMAQPLGQDTQHVRAATKALGHGKVWKTVHSPADALRNLFQITESVPRVAEMIQVSKTVGWDGRSPMTKDQAIAIANAGKRITTDFTAAGRIGRVVNQIVPFYNANIQGTRSMGRAFQKNRTGAVLRGLSLLTAPTLALWWQNKDKDWYKDMPWREKFGSWFIEEGDEAIRIPRPYDWGNVFSVLPEAIADSAYREDPEGFKRSLGYTFDNFVPDLFGSPAIKVPKEQLQNKSDWTQIPIVPRNEQDMPVEEQVGPYTTNAAKFLGEALGWSPRRIDHVVRGVFGGVGEDVSATVFGRVAAKRDRGFEMADIPIAGTLFRRGGKEGTSSQAVNDLYERRAQLTERENSESNPETAAERAERIRLKAAAAQLKVLRAALYDTASTLEERQKIQRKMREIAQGARKPQSNPGGK